MFHILKVIHILEAQLWRFRAVGDERTCKDCMKYDGKVFHVEDPSELEDKFPYGEFEDAHTFRPNIHPNCRCIIKRIYSGE